MKKNHVGMRCKYQNAVKAALTLSKDLGNQTVLSGSVSKGKDSTRSLQMISRPLMTSDELKSMSKGSFITMKTGMHPMKTKFQLFLKWGITSESPFELPEQSARKVQYAGKEELLAAIQERYLKLEPQNEFQLNNAEWKKSKSGLRV